MFSKKKIWPFKRSSLASAWLRICATAAATSATGRWSSLPGSALLQKSVILPARQRIRRRAVASAGATCTSQPVAWRTSAACSASLLSTASSASLSTTADQETSLHCGGSQPCAKTVFKPQKWWMGSGTSDHFPKMWQLSNISRHLWGLPEKQHVVSCCWRIYGSRMGARRNNNLFVPLVQLSHNYFLNPQGSDYLAKTTASSAHCFCSSLFLKFSLREFLSWHTARTSREFLNYHTSRISPPEFESRCKRKRPYKDQTTLETTGYKMENGWDWNSST